MSPPPDTVKIRLRATARQVDLIDRACDRLGLSRSEFVLGVACSQATEVLLDQTYFALDAKRFAEFQSLLDHPPEPTDRLARTLNARAPWTS